jgi:hypothetical protein
MVGPGRPKTTNKRVFPKVCDTSAAGSTLEGSAAGDHAMNVSLGSQPNASPIAKPSRAKKQKTYKTGMGSIGLGPNVNYLAMPCADLAREQNYLPMQGICDLSQTADSVMSLPFSERQALILYSLPQRSELWSAVRGTFDLTGTSLGIAIGFNEQCSEAFFENDKLKCYPDHDKVGQLFTRLRDGMSDAPISPISFAMDWGSLHEPNCKITALRAMRDMTLREVGIAELHLGSLHASVLSGVDCSSVPKMGASPDGIACLGEQSCGLFASHFGRYVARGTKVLFEAKCKSAFVDASKSGPGKFKFQGPGAMPPKAVLPHWYAQVQLGMMAADVSLTLLAVYHTGSTMLVCIPRDDRWCHMMLKSVQWFMQTFVQTGTAPPVNFCEAMPGYAEFMTRTRRTAA